MSFNATAHDIELHRGHILRAKVKNIRGHYVESEIDLNNYIGNSDGYFVWDGRDFSHTAKDIDLKHSHEGPKLVAKLKRVDGSYSDHMGILLSDRISNNDGKLVYVTGEL